MKRCIKPFIMFGCFISVLATARTVWVVIPALIFAVVAIHDTREAR